MELAGRAFGWSEKSARGIWPTRHGASCIAENLNQLGRKWKHQEEQQKNENNKKEKPKSEGPQMAMAARCFSPFPSSKNADLHRLGVRVRALSTVK